MSEELYVPSRHRLPQSMVGPVVAGERRGRTLGFPTANLEPPAAGWTPGPGVYAGRARTARDQARPWSAAISVGTRPTFVSALGTLVEVHLIGFDGDLYGKTLEVTFLARLRDELAFADAESLVRQIRKDVRMAREIAESASGDSSARPLRTKPSAGQR
jgi:riboflavin kinase/FMN adenylyltransferase